MGLIGVVAAMAWCPPVAAQFHRESMTVAEADAYAVVEETAPIRNLFERADGGAARQDWKLVIDSLQRIIARPLAALVPATQAGDADDASSGSAGRRTARKDRGDRGRGPSEPARFESARHAAVRYLAALPHEAIEAYRVLYDGNARRLLDEGLAGGRRAPIQKLADEYFHSSFGDDACDLLASAALDAGRPAEALAWLDRIRDDYVGADVPAARVAAKRLAAEALLERDRRTSNVRTTALQAAGTSEHALDAALAAWQPSPPCGESWPMLNGSPARSAVMPAVSPSLTSHDVWSALSPDGRADEWDYYVRTRSSDDVVIPSRYGVAAEGRIFVRTLTGCAALDLEGLGWIWQSRRAGDAWFERPGDTGLARVSTRERLFEDPLGSSLAWLDGLVCYIDADWRSAPVDRFDLRRRFPFALSEPSFFPSRLVALDASTGDVRWTLGDDDVIDARQTPRFVGTPMSAEGSLWAPFLSGRDLFLGRIDPDAGSLIDRILVCSLTEWETPDRGVLDMAAGAGLVFVPTGAGAVAAVDVAQGGVAWLAFYRENSNSAVGRRAAPARTPSPPVLAGDVLVVLPDDDAVCVAFDAFTGRQIWRRRVEADRYVIAARGDALYLGGGNVLRLDLRTGSDVWAVSVAGPQTGRSVLSDDAVLCPTTRGLVAISASDGTVRETIAQPEGSPPLGNLLVAGGALLSIEGASVRKFPDFQRSYPAALEAHQADPDDERASLRLAWLELLQGRPDAALSALGSIEAGRPSAGVESSEVARLKVRIYLALAAAEADGDGAVELIHRAMQAALDDNDRLLAALAYADRAAHSAGAVDALQVLWKLAVSEPASQLRPTVGGARAPQREELGRRIDDLHQRLAPADGHAFTQWIEQSIEEYTAQLSDPRTARLALAALKAVAILPGIGGSDRQALMMLAAHYERGRQYEIAEQYLERLSLAGDVTPDALAAWMRLCDAHASYGFVRVERLSWLRQRFGAFPIPPAYTGDRRKATTIDQWASRCLGPHLTGSGRGQSEDATSYTFVAERPGFRAFDTDDNRRPLMERLVTVEGAESAETPSHWIAYGPAHTLRAREPGSGSIVWEAPLTLRGDFRIDASDANLIAQHPRRAVGSGSILVVSSAYGLHAVGIGSGKRLWNRAYDIPLSDMATAARDGALAVNRTVLAATPREGAVTLMSLADGETIWEADLNGRTVETLKIVDDLVVAIEPTREYVTVLDLRTGALRCEIEFRQPDPEEDLVDLIIDGKVIIGPEFDDRRERIDAFDLGTGAPLWQYTLSGTLVQLFSPADGYVAAGSLTGDVVLLEADTGALMMTGAVRGARAVVAGRLTAGVLEVEYSVRGRGIDARRLAALDPNTGQVLWRRDDTIALPGRAAPRFPAAVEEVREQERAPRGISVAMLDVRTGEQIGPAAPLKSENSRDSLTGDFLLREGRFIAGTERGYLFYRMDGTSEDSGN